MGLDGFHLISAVLDISANAPMPLLLRFYESENPRAVLVGGDTLDEPT